MKTTLTCIALSLLLNSFAQADWRWNKDQQYGAKSPIVEQRVTSSSYCFDTGFEFSGFVSGFWPQSQVGSSSSSIGGGVGFAYFFGHNFGLEASYAAHGGSTSQQVGKFNAVYRFPLGGECCSTVAPYVFGGFGFVSAGSSESLWNVGGGVDIRFESWGCIGLFGDVSYNWVDQTIPNFTQARLGFRVPF